MVSTDGRTDGQTDGRTDGRTDTEGYNIIPRHTLVAGYKKGFNLNLVYIPILLYSDVPNQYHDLRMFSGLLQILGTSELGGFHKVFRFILLQSCFCFFNILIFIN